jgi:hypothetical protein
MVVTSVRRSIVATLVTALAIGAAPMTVPPAAAGTATWHALRAAKVEAARITLENAQAIDPTISAIIYGTGGEANTEQCGFNRTEQISVARHTKWDAGSRTGVTLIMQFQSIVDAQTVFTRMKNLYVPCTNQTFGYRYPARVDVTGKYLTKRHELRLQWAIYSDATKTTTLKANGLAIKRQGAALLITRSTTKDLATINQPINSQLTAKQSERYKAAAYF